MPDRVIVLANEIIANARHSLPTNLRSDSSYARDVLVIAPMLTSRLQSMTSDIDAAYQAALERLKRIAFDMSTFRTPPLTTVGDENQLLAVNDAMSTFNADACVVITHTQECANHHEHGVPDQIRAQFNIPTITLTVDAHGHIIDHQSPWQPTTNRYHR